MGLTFSRVFERLVRYKWTWHGFLFHRRTIRLKYAIRTRVGVRDNVCYGKDLHHNPCRIGTHVHLPYGTYWESLIQPLPSRTTYLVSIDVPLHWSTSHISLNSSLCTILIWQFGKKEMRILMVGLDAAGKTTILYKLKLGEGKICSTRNGLAWYTGQCNQKML